MTRLIGSEWMPNPRGTARSTLVVTRPRDDARTLIDSLEARGYDVIAFPVLTIEPVDDPTTLAAAMARVDDYRLVVFVSPNAIRHALAHRRAPWPRATVVGVMGPGSVAALAALGIAAPDHQVVSPARPDRDEGGNDAQRFDSEALFTTLAATLGLAEGDPGRVLIVRGNGGRGWLADRLRGLRIAVDEVESYRRAVPVPEPAALLALRRRFDQGIETRFIVTSSEGLAHLTTLAEGIVELAPALPDSGPALVRDWLFGCELLVPHQRIAENARVLGYRRITLTGPGDRGVVASIE